MEIDQTGIATILPCLLAHNLVFDNDDLSLNFPNLYLVCLFKYLQIIHNHETHCSQCRLN